MARKNCKCVLHCTFKKNIVEIKYHLNKQDKSEKTLADIAQLLIKILGSKKSFILLTVVICSFVFG
jgi:hypothetical protein